MNLQTYIPVSSRRNNLKEFYFTVLMVLSLAFLPVYLLPSGGLQLVDVFLIIVVISIPFVHDKFKDLALNNMMYLAPYTIWVIVVNLIYFACNYHDVMLLKKTLEAIYIFVLTYSLMVLFSIVISSNKFNYFYIGALFLILFAFTIKGSADMQGVRFVFSFNNPNQMGYFGIIIMSFVLVLTTTLQPKLKSTKFTTIMLYAMVVCAHLFVVFSCSRAALGGILIVDSYYVFKIGWKKLLLYALLAIAVSLIVCIIKPDVIDIVSRMQDRIVVMDVLGRTDRQFDRMIFKHDWQIVVGVGSGLTEAAPDGLEVHNAWGSTFRVYGIVGFVLLFIWIMRIVLLSCLLEGGIFITMALFLYNFFHNGFRFRSFWMLIALIMCLTLVTKGNRTFLETIQTFRKKGTR